MSVPHSNSTQTTAIPTAVAERTRRTLAAPFTAVSIGNVTSISISSGAIPRPSTRIVTVGAVRSGNTSTGIVVVTYPPTSTSTADKMTTASRFERDHRINALTITVPP